MNSEFKQKLSTVIANLHDYANRLKIWQKPSLP